MKHHTPTIRLTAARRRLTLARETCPHWDYEADGSGHECCKEVSDALHEVRLARHTVQSIRSPRGQTFASHCSSPRGSAHEVHPRAI